MQNEFEIMWKAEVVTYVGQQPAIYLEGLRKIAENLERFSTPADVPIGQLSTKSKNVAFRVCLIGVHLSGSVPNYKSRVDVQQSTQKLTSGDKRHPLVWHFERSHKNAVVNVIKSHLCLQANKSRSAARSFRGYFIYRRRKSTAERENVRF